MRPELFHADGHRRMGGRDETQSLFSIFAITPNSSRFCKFPPSHLQTIHSTNIMKPTLHTTCGKSPQFHGIITSFRCMKLQIHNGFIIHDETSYGDLLKLNGQHVRKRQFRSELFVSYHEMKQLYLSLCLIKQYRTKLYGRWRYNSTQS